VEWSFAVVIPTGRLTLSEVYALLNQLDVETVAQEMKEWHPSILAEMLKAVARAKQLRYLSSHPDWNEAVRQVAEDTGFDMPGPYDRTEAAKHPGAS